jgi:hypothetical protein
MYIVVRQALDYLSEKKKAEESEMRRDGEAFYTFNTIEQSFNPKYSVFSFLIRQTNE